MNHGEFRQMAVKSNPSIYEVVVISKITDEVFLEIRGLFMGDPKTIGMDLFFALKFADFNLKSMKSGKYLSREPIRRPFVAVNALCIDEIKTRVRGNFVGVFKGFIDKANIEQGNKEQKESKVKEKAEEYNINYTDLISYEGVPDLELINEQQSRDLDIFIFSRNGKNLNIAIADHENNETMAIIKNLESQNFNISLYLASKESINSIQQLYSFH